MMCKPTEMVQIGKADGRGNNIRMENKKKWRKDGKLSMEKKLKI